MSMSMAARRLLGSASPSSASTRVISSDSEPTLASISSSENCAAAPVTERASAEKETASIESIDCMKVLQDWWTLQKENRAAKPLYRTRQSPAKATRQFLLLVLPAE